MRTRLSVLGVGVALLVGGCTQASAQGPQPVPEPAAPEPPAAAAAAGGACELLDFATVAQALGSRFDIAAATRQKKTHTCVLQATGASRPDLVLTVSPTSVDAELFKETVRPEGGRGVIELGRTAYRVIIGAGKGRGPAVEVGWLSAEEHLLTLRYTLAPGAPESRAESLTPKLVSLAKRVDAAHRQATATELGPAG